MFSTIWLADVRNVIVPGSDERDWDPVAKALVRVAPEKVRRDALGSLVSSVFNIAQELGLVVVAAYIASRFF